MSPRISLADCLGEINEVVSTLYSLWNITVKVLVTGSSGYVASDLIPRLCNKAKVYGIDLSPSEFTDIQVSIADQKLNSYLETMTGEGIYVVNLAAARFDFGATAKDYFRLNVECHANFLESLEIYRIKKFIHVSSVASLDGRNISYSEELKCDDAYRSTVFAGFVLKEP